MKALTLWQPWASLCVTPPPCSTCGDQPCLACRGTRATPSGRYLCGSCDGLHCPDCPRPPFKTIETRGWAAPRSLIGQRIAIHAAVKRPPHMMTVGPFLVNRKGDGTTVMYHEAECLRLGHDRHIDLPLGAVLGTAVLADCIPMVAPIAIGEHDLDEVVLQIGRPEPESLRIIHRWSGGGKTLDRVDDQRPFGLFEPGRWAWLLTDQERFDEPVPARGGQRIWNWEPS